MKFRVYTLLIIIVSSTNSLFAQKQTWTLQDCIDYAFRNNIAVKQSEINVMNSELNLRQSQYNRLPNLNANTSGRNNVGRSIDPFTNVIVDQDVTSQSYSASSNLTVYNGLLLTNTIKQNKANLSKSEYDLETQKNTTALNIANLFLNILLNQEQLASARLSFETSQLQLERTQKQVDVGALPIQNLLQSKQQVANDEVNVINAENALELSILSLKQALQLPASTEMLVEAPELPSIDATTVEMDLEDLYMTSSSIMPEIKAAEQQVKSSYYGIKVAKAGRMPTLSLGGGLSSAYSSAAPDQFPDPSSPTGFKENTYLNQLDFNLNRSISLTLSIPIFNRFQNNTNVAQAKLQLENSKYQEANTKNQLRQTIEQSYYNARAAAKTYIATNRQVEALEESFRNVEQRFNLGAVNAVEYNQTKNDLNRAKNDFIRAKYDFIFKQKVLEFYQGKPLKL